MADFGRPIGRRKWVRPQWEVRSFDVMKHTRHPKGADAVGDEIWGLSKPPFTRTVSPNAAIRVVTDSEVSGPVTNSRVACSEPG